MPIGPWTGRPEGLLSCERIRPDLELDDLPLRALAAFDVPDEVRAVVRVERAALPSCARVVDAPVHPARIEAERVRNAQFGPVARPRIQCEQRVGVRSGGERCVGAEAGDVVLIHPVVIVEVSGDVRAFQLRTGGLIQRPAFAALAAVDLRGSVEVLALAYVETREVAAGRERGPHHAVAVDVHAARIEAGLRHLEDLRLAGRWRVAPA